MPRGNRTEFDPKRRVDRYAFDIANMAAMTSPNYGKEDYCPMCGANESHDQNPEAPEHWGNDKTSDAEGVQGMDSGFSETEKRD
jgi:hypothetical protein